MAFSLKKAVLALYQRAVSTPAMRHPFPLVDPNNLLGVDNNPNAHTACALTGMLPLHVAVVNGVRNMFDFLIDLPGLDVPAELSLHAQRLRTSSKGTWTNPLPRGVQWDTKSTNGPQACCGGKRQQCHVCCPPKSAGDDAEEKKSAGGDLSHAGHSRKTISKETYKRQVKTTKENDK